MDFAQVLKYTLNILYLRAEKITLVTDNLNTHSTAHCIKHFHHNKNIGLLGVLNGIIHQNIGAGLI